jgi:hypothetical protein
MRVLWVLVYRAAVEEAAGRERAAEERTLEAARQQHRAECAAEAARRQLADAEASRGEGFVAASRVQKQLLSAQRALEVSRCSRIPPLQCSSPET